MQLIASTHYLSYKALKKHIKGAATASAEDSPEFTSIPLPPPLLLDVHANIAFFYELDRNVEVVDDFFSKKSAEMQRRLKLLQEKYGDGQNDLLDFHDVDDLVLTSQTGD